MEIKLNNNDIHAAIRGFLQERNIVDSYTELDIAITVSRGTNSGASADVTILEATNTSLKKDEATPPKPSGALFNANED